MPKLRHIWLLAGLLIALAVTAFWDGIKKVLPRDICLDINTPPSLRAGSPLLSKEGSLEEKIAVQGVSKEGRLGEKPVPSRCKVGHASVSHVGARRAAPSAKEIMVAAPDLTEKVRCLESERDSWQQRYTTLGTWVLDNFQGKYPLAVQHLTNVQFTAFNDDWTLNNELANFLHLNREQYEYVNDAVNYAVSLLVMLEENYLQWQTPEPGKIVIDILPFPEEGLQLQEDLYSAIESTAGSERLDLFVNAAQASLDECFHYFGKATRSLVFQRTYVDGKPRLFIYDGWYWLGDNGRNDMRATELVVEKIPPAYACFVQYLPAEIRDWLDRPAQQLEEAQPSGFEL